MRRRKQKEEEQNRLVISSTEQVCYGPVDLSSDEEETQGLLGIRVLEGV